MSRLNHRAYESIEVANKQQREMATEANEKAKSIGEDIDGTAGHHKYSSPTNRGINFFAQQRAGVHQKWRFITRACTGPPQAALAPASEDGRYEARESIQ